MSVFDDVVLEWDGDQKTVPAEGVMRLIAKVEDVLTLHELYSFLERGTAPLAKVSMAYSVALKFAGFQTTDDAVYARLITAGRQADTAATVVRSLLSMMVPPEDLDVQRVPESGETSGKRKAVSNSSKKPLKRQSGKTG